MEGKREGRAMWNMMKEKSLDTGIQGIPNITRARSYFRKFFWSLIVVGGCVILSWQITVSVMKYYSYPTKTELKYNTGRQLPFPAVTICNLNALRVSKLSSAPGGAFDAFQTTSTATSSQPASFNDFSSETSSTFTTENSDYTAMQNFMTQSSKLTPSERKDIGHHLNTMLISCSYNGLTCSPTNFTWFNNYLYGNCYTFNAHDPNSTIVTNKIGPIYGLSLELYIEQDEYVESLSDSAGVVITVHNQTEMPFPEDEGISVSPGTKANVAIKRVEVIRSPPPHGICITTSDADNMAKNSFIHTNPNIGYSASACRKTCYQSNLMDTCGCFDTKYPSSSNISAYTHVGNLSTMVPCTDSSMQTPEKIACEENILNKFIANTLGCEVKCPIPCTQNHYEFSISQSSYPSNAKLISVQNQLMEKSQYMWDLFGNYTEPQKKTYVQENSVKANIFFKDLDFEIIDTQPSYTVTDLLSDFGGQAGLWLGVSVIAFFELFELIFDICAVAAKKKAPMKLVAPAPPTTSDSESPRTSPQPPVIGQNWPTFQRDANAPVN